MLVYEIKSGDQEDKLLAQMKRRGNFIYRYLNSIYSKKVYYLGFYRKNYENNNENNLSENNGNSEENKEKEQKKNNIIFNYSSKELHQKEDISFYHSILNKTLNNTQNNTNNQSKEKLIKIKKGKV